MHATAKRPETTRALLARLHALKGRFAPADRRAKAALLRALRARPLTDVPSLLQLHETLCFLRAYPDGPETLRLAEEGLQGIAACVDRLCARGPRQRTALQDTGIARTTVYYPFSYAMARWLLERFPGTVEIDWEDAEGLTKLREILPLLTVYAEGEALDDEGIATRDWLRAARRAWDGSDLRALLNLLDQAPLPRDTGRHLYESLELLLSWELQDPAVSRTLLHWPGGRTFYQRGPLRRGPIDLARAIRRPLPALRAVPARTGEQLIHLFRAALSVRHRELFPMAHANPQDVFLVEVGRGLRIALIGMAPAFRLALEGYYSFLALKNGVPVAYGGGAALFDRVEIATNVFESFRQGESSAIFGQACRAFHHLFGSRVFLVKRYQVGHGNPEAIQSGAFWFYSKLGFRPVEPAVGALAAAEAKKIQADPAYRSSPETLRRLAESDLGFSLAGVGGGPASILDQGQIGLRVSRRIAAASGGDRAAAGREMTQAALLGLGIQHWRQWSMDEQAALERLAPILVLIPDLPRWTAAEKRALVRIIRAKGGQHEAGYIRLLRRHRRLGQALQALAAPGPAEDGP